MHMKFTSIIALILIKLLLSVITIACCLNSLKSATLANGSTAVRIFDQKDIEDWIKNSSTFEHDGIPGSIRIINIISSVEGNSTISAGEWEFNVEYKTIHRGHGDRADQALDQCITNHTAVIQVENGIIVSAVCCDIWDMQKESTLTASKAPLPTVSEDITWQIKDTVAAATITRPDDEDIHPAIVFVAGSGPTDRDWNSPFLPGTNGSARLLAEDLAGNGYVTIRYDKRIAGPNAQKNLPFMLGKISMEGHVNELAGAVDMLAARADVDPDRIFVLANSEGTIHALNYQLTRERKFAGLILSAMPGRSMSAVLRSQLEAQLASLPHAEEIMAGYDKLMADCLAGKPFVADPAVPDSINNLVQGFFAPINSPFTREFISFDPAPLLEKVTVPALVIIGRKDIQVDPLLDGIPLESAAYGLDNISFVYPDNANHVLKYEPRPRLELTGADAAITYNAPDRILDPESFQIIENWLKRNR
jgi:pimeloyl-ACP methyl ester carboxylesterase